MKLALVAALSQANRVDENLQQLKEQTIKAKKEEADLVLFGEAFLHGFQTMNFTYEEDIEKCFSDGSPVIAELRNFAKDKCIGIGFGYYENHRGAIYGSYMILDDQGEVLLNYRRVSKGWKEPQACADYREGKAFKSFRYQGKELGLMVCGDFWEDDLLSAIVNMDAVVDAFIWPVHCDYDVTFWEKEERQEYAKRTEILAQPVFFINNYSVNPEEAKGGLYHWQQGKTLASEEMGKEAMLLVEI